MFEGAIITAHAAESAGPGLRPLDWAELVARLSAARDLRATLVRPRTRGSFALGSASGLAGPHGQRDVNLDALARGKGPAGIRAAAVHQAAIGDRDN